MVLKELKEELIGALHRECDGFAIYGENIRQNFERPCLVVKLQEGQADWEGGRSRITAVFRMCVFGEEEDRQFDRLGEIAAAVQSLSAACTRLTFEEKESYLEVMAAFVMRAQLAKTSGTFMKKLTEDMRIG